MEASLKKQGFTLIELMVVIVILGILVAIAIPKLFGISAKAKAAEVGPAAGTWSKLAHTYYGETASMGNWTTIGYQAPGEPVAGTGKSLGRYFEYKDPDYGTVPVAFHWQAKALKISGACDGQIWSAESNGMNTVVKGFGCADLTPNFKNLQ